MMIREWVRLPSAWIDGGGLAAFSWKPGGNGADHIAALMVLTALAHAADQDSGEARRTYDDLGASTGLSRAKLAKGLSVLKGRNLIEGGPDAVRSTYRLIDYGLDHHWAQLPAKSMYSAANRIAAFTDFQLRRAVELDALKLFFTFVARRGRGTNLALIGYDKIEQYTGVRRDRIKPATSFLASLSLIYVEHVSTANGKGIANAYRVVGLDSYNHRGTRGRAMTEFDFQNSDVGPTPNRSSAEIPDFSDLLS